MYRRKIVKCLLYGRIFTNIGDSILYMFVIWYLNKDFSSPMLLSMAFAVLAVVDALTVFIGPIIDSTVPKQNLFWMSLFQIVCIACLIILSFFTKLDIHQREIMLLNVLLFTYIASSIIYTEGVNLIPLLVSNDELIHTNSLFHTSEKVLDVTFNALSALVISFFKEDIIIIFILLFFLLAAKFHKIVACYHDNLYRRDFLRKKERYSIMKYIEELKRGFQEVKSHSEIILLLFPLSIINMFYGIAMVGLPKVSEIYISGMAYGYGSLLMSASLGGVLGSYLICRFPKSIYAPKKYTKIFLFIAGIAWLLMVVTIKYCFWFSFLFIFISNCGINMMNVMFVSIIQKEIDLSLLGRVSTFTESLVSIIIPLGNLIGGVILVLFNPLLSQMLYGVAMILCSIFISPKFVAEKRESGI